MNCIKINKLSFLCQIGFKTHEQNRRQKIELDISLYICPLPAETPDIKQSARIDYALVTQCVKEFVTRTSFVLLEKLAQKVAQKILSEFLVQKVRVVARKFPSDLPEVECIEYIHVEVQVEKPS